MSTIRSSEFGLLVIFPGVSKRNKSAWQTGLDAYDATFRPEISGEAVRCLSVSDGRCIWRTEHSEPEAR